MTAAIGPIAIRRAAEKVIDGYRATPSVQVALYDEAVAHLRATATDAQAAALFGLARTLERQHGLTVDPAAVARGHLDLAAALSAKAVAAYGTDLLAVGDAAAYLDYRAFCVTR